MKVTNLPLLFLATGLATLQTTAAPLHVIVVSSTPSPDESALAHLRWGLAAANVRPAMAHSTETVNITITHPTFGSKSGTKKGGCMRMKAIALSNWFREKMGMPLIATGHHGQQSEGMLNDNVATASRIRVLPLHHQPGPIHHPSTFDSPLVAQPIYPHHRHGHGWHPKSFSGRLHKALMTLGPWEGRLVAFVLGCGIGSLLRMIYVLAVVSYRCGRGSATEDEVIFVEVEEVTPPAYPVEKVAIVEENA